MFSNTQRLYIKLSLHNTFEIFKQMKVAPTKLKDMSWMITPLHFNTPAVDSIR